MRAHVQTAHGVYLVDLDEEEVLELDATARLSPPPPLDLGLPLVLADGRVRRIDVRPLHDVDPTGAGDAFSVAYLAARSEGHAPAASARRASALVYGLLKGRLR